MLYQEKRSVVYLISNLLVSTIYALYIFLGYHDKLVLSPDDRVLWATVILIFIPVQIAARLVIVIVLGIIHKIAVAEEPINLEDELDKLIDLKATRIFYGVFMAGLVPALGSQAIGLPLYALFVLLGIAMVLAGLVGDLAQLILYRRGV